MIMFDKASRLRLRFNYKGVISTEDLWDLSLQELDFIYKGLMAQKKALNVDSLLTTPTPADDLLELKLDIVRFVFNAKQDEADSRKAAAEKKAKKQKLLDVLSQKQDSALAEMSIEDIQKAIDELG